MNEKIIRLITEYTKAYPGVRHTETAWREPVIGFADADDPLFAELKNIIGPNHALPSDIVPGAKSVIVFFLPFAKDIVKSNIPEEESSRAWDYAYIETNQLINDLSQYLFDAITGMGYQASLLPPTYNYDAEKLVSDWSHRSVAYIAGIGKFGINNMFITENGCCGRLGSVITDLALTPAARPEEEYCLYKKDGSCKKCLERCVNHAFGLDNGRVSFDRYKCNEQIYEKIIPEYPIGLGDTCGKCMCGVPCSFGIPGKK
ncbi:epoxyqueuosine reductase [Eubacterium sp. 1001713B170207_170306_E7]|uniref:epoxyqueuosine reductase n=1 Tax=Eubacterium sp. 1001713B170207_170306_E7 TaxID=2787097 RepID=UPI0018989017|nr:epoxyqueuosine reductase [Eubacterium sp. 1001713B170207_170306_E7]